MDDSFYKGVRKLKQDILKQASTCYLNEGEGTWYASFYDDWNILHTQRGAEAWLEARFEDAYPGITKRLAEWQESTEAP